MSIFEQSRKYTVYDNRTDLPVAVCATAQECAKAMGITTNSFHVYLSPSAGPRGKRWTIVKEGLCVDLQEDPKTMGEFMLVCRLKRGLTRPQLAELSGVPLSNIRQYELDKVFPSIMNVVCIADALNVSIDELIGRKVK